MPADRDRWTDVATVGQVFLAVVLLIAGVTKLTNYDGFLRTLASIPWLSLRFARPAARVIPILEVTLAIAVVLLPPIGAWGAVAVLTLFTVVVAKEMTAGRDFRCGCFGGVEGRPVGLQTLLRNLILIAAAIAVALAPGARTTGAILVGLGLGMLLVLFEFGAEALAEVRPQ